MRFDKKVPDKHMVSVFLLFLIALIVFLNSLGSEFIWDDKLLIVKNSFIKNVRAIPILFTPTYWKYHYSGARGQYRPVRTVAFALDYALWKNNPRGYHFTNILLHAFNVILIYFLICLLCGNTNRRFFNVPFLSGLFFAVHPIHTESVNWIKNRSDLLALLFFISALIFFIKHVRDERKNTFAKNYIISILCFILSLLSKEMALSLPAILILYIISFPPYNTKKAIMLTVPFFLTALAYLAFKSSVLGMIVSAGNANSPGFFPNILAAITTLGYYTALLVNPFDLRAERAFRIPESMLEWQVILPLLVILLFLYLLIVFYRRSKIYFFGLSWIILSIIPASNIIYLSGRPIAEQRLYIPSVGACLLLSLFLTKISRRSFAFLLCAILSVSYSARTIKRNPDWKDSLTFWEKTARQSEKSDRAYYNLGYTYNDMGRTREAIEAYEKALELNDSDSDIYHNLATAYFSADNPDKAADLYKKAINIDPHNAKAYFNYAVLRYNLNDLEEAVNLYKKTLEINPYHSDAYNNLGVVYESRGETEKAIDSYNNAISANPNNADAHCNVAVLYVNLGRLEEAMASLKHAVRSDPEHATAHHNLAKIYYYQREPELSMEHYKKAVKFGYVFAPEFIEYLTKLKKQKQGH